jgi:beta,beta-carotene 9',10'-dioxygenase
MRLLFFLGLLLILSRSAASSIPSQTSQAALGFQTLPWGFAVKGAQLPIKGVIPQWLSGSLYRNGPAMFMINTTNHHWFDGLGLLQGFNFTNGRVTYNAQFIGSTPYNESKPNNNNNNNNRAVDPCKAFLGRAQTEFSPNTGVTVNKLAGPTFLTNTASALSNQFDPVTLGNVANPFIFDDDIPGALSPEHRQTDPQGNLYHFYYSFGPNANYSFYWIPAGTLKRIPLADARVNRKIGSPCYLHSFGLTERFIILSEIPVPIPAVFQWSNFKMAPGLPVEWRVFERTTGREVATFTSPPFFMFHHIAAYEDKKDNTLVVDLITFPDASLIDDLYIDTLVNNPHRTVRAALEGKPHRYRLPMNTPGVTVRGMQLSSYAAELPTINYGTYNTKPYRYFYAISLSGPQEDFYNQLIKVDTFLGTTTTWRIPDTYPGEPIFVPAPNPKAEDDGVILSVVLDPQAKSSFLVVLNATTFTEMARATAPHWVPFGFHGLFSH